MERFEEMIGLELELDVLDDPVIEHHRAEKRRLRLDILGKRRRLGGKRCDYSNGIGHVAIIPPTGVCRKLCPEKFRGADLWMNHTCYTYCKLP